MVLCICIYVVWTSNVPLVTIVCIPPCSNSEVICTWDHGGNGFNGSTDCRQHCGEPNVPGSACMASSTNICYWGWTNDTGWACFSGPPPCLPYNDILDDTYMTCAGREREGYGCDKLADCTKCCSGYCLCRDLVEDKQFAYVGNQTLDCKFQNQINK